MKPTIKKIAAAFLLLLGFLPILIAFSFRLRQDMIRHEMREALEKKLLQTIQVPSNELRWAQEGKELWVNGELFDVASIVESNGSWLVTGLFDHAETLLVNQLKESEENESRPGNKDLIQVLVLLITPFNNSADETDDPVRLALLHHAGIQAQLPSFYLSVPTPPPQLT